MITFRANEGTQIATVVGKTKTPLYWYPYKEEDRQIKVQDYSDFNTQEMRDRFMLSKGQATSIMDHLSKNTEPEDVLQAKYFALPHARVATEVVEPEEQGVQFFSEAFLLPCLQNATPLVIFFQKLH